MPIETREVLGACYLGPNKGRTMLSHAVEISPEGEIIRVLCGRVSELSIADKYAQDTTLAPTCRHCAARLRKLKGDQP